MLNNRKNNRRRRAGKKDRRKKSQERGKIEEKRKREIIWLKTAATVQCAKMLHHQGQRQKWTSGYSVSSVNSGFTSSASTSAMVQMETGGVISVATLCEGGKAFF